MSLSTCGWQLRAENSCCAGVHTGFCPGFRPELFLGFDGVAVLTLFFVVSLHDPSHARMPCSRMSTDACHAAACPPTPHATTMCMLLTQKPCACSHMQQP
eukprot:351094-Chlamydomonas_euryale.AAC.1